MGQYISGQKQPLVLHHFNHVALKATLIGETLFALHAMQPNNFDMRIQTLCVHYNRIFLRTFYLYLHTDCKKTKDKEIRAYF